MIHWFVCERSTRKWKHSIGGSSGWSLCFRRFGFFGFFRFFGFFGFLRRGLLASLLAALLLLSFLFLTFFLCCLRGRLSGIDLGNNSKNENKFEQNLRVEKIEEIPSSCDERKRAGWHPLWRVRGDPILREKREPSSAPKPSCVTVRKL